MVISQTALRIIERDDRGVGRILTALDSLGLARNASSMLSGSLGGTRRLLATVKDASSLAR